MLRFTKQSCDIAKKKTLLIASTMVYKATAFPTATIRSYDPIISGALFFYCQKLMLTNSP